MTSTLGPPWPDNDIDTDGQPLIHVDQQPSMYAKKGRQIEADAREEMTLRLMEFQFAAIVLMRRYGTTVTKITPQEVQLAKHIGIKADIDDDGGITVTVQDTMGS